jgi:site-specific recombinase XerD
MEKMEIKITNPWGDNPIELETTTNCRTLLNDFKLKLMIRCELCETTAEKYKRDTKKFLDYMDKINPLETKLDKEHMIDYKHHLIKNYSIGTVNSYIFSINKFWKENNREDLLLKTLRTQSNESYDNVISVEDYKMFCKYLDASNNQKYYAFVRLLGSTGMRVGEAITITKEDAEVGKFVVRHKAKTREVIITSNVSTLLLNYCWNQRITSGIIFKARDEAGPCSKAGIWKGLKMAASDVDINPDRVYPHSFRHMFAKEHLKTYHDLMELSDILGHSSLNTTRRYLSSSTEEKRKRLEDLDL